MVLGIGYFTEQEDQSSYQPRIATTRQAKTRHIKQAPIKNNDESTKNAGTVSVPNDAKPLSIPQSTPVPVLSARWPSQNVTIFMKTKNSMLQHDYQQAVNEWNNTHAVNIKWTNDEDKANIIADEQDLAANDQQNGDEVVETLGQTTPEYIPDLHQLTKAYIVIDPGKVSRYDKQHQVWVIDHELGHALGLRHAREDQQSVMVPVNAKCGIQPDDINTIKALYNEH